MKGRKYRRSQRFIQTVYEKGFGLRPPYQIILDAEMVREAMRHKVLLREALPVVFGGPVKILITSCVLEELGRLDRQGGDVPGSSLLMAKRSFELLRKCCNMPKDGSSTRCLVETIKAAPDAHFAIGAQQVELRGILRRDHPGVPIIFIRRGMALLEEPSPETRRIALEREQVKLAVPEFERKALQVVESSSSTRLRRKRKRKNPNPLSVKKKKKKIPLETKKEEKKLLTAPETPKPRKRRHRKKKSSTSSSP